MNPGTHRVVRAPDFFVAEMRVVLEGASKADRRRTEGGPRADRGGTEGGPRTEGGRTEDGPRADRGRTEVQRPSLAPSFVLNMAGLY